jgi:hypothetical protein
MDDESDPGYEEVKHVCDMFAKHSLKTIQKQHPLFARGADEKLALSVRGPCLPSPPTQPHPTPADSNLYVCEFADAGGQTEGDMLKAEGKKGILFETNISKVSSAYFTPPAANP